MIFLEKICQDSDWHLATVVEELKKQGVNPQDAEAYAEFVFADKAGGNAEECLTDEQYERISLNKLLWVLKDY